jgi:HK97 family phage prohead protease
MSKNLTEFGERVVTLNTGAQGLRGGLRCEVRDLGGDDPVMDFIASDATLDRYNEVIQQDGWQLDNFRANPVIPDCHDYSSIGKILGRARSVNVTDGKLVNRVEFCTDNPMGNLAWKMAKGGFIKSQSVGFIPLEWKVGSGKDEPYRTYTKCELLEISLVVVPANPGATVGLALKSGAITRRDLTDVVEFLRSVEMLHADIQPGALVKLDPAYSQNHEERRAKFLSQVGKVTAIVEGFGMAFVKFPLEGEPICIQIECLLLAEKKEFCGEEAGPETPAGASSAGTFDAQLLQLARSMKGVLTGG